MKKVKAFLYIFSKSLIPRKKYYQQIVRTPLRFSLKYFIFLIISLNLIFFISFLFQYRYQKIYHFLYQIKNTLENYPEDLQLYVRNGTLLTNSDKPYFLWLTNNGKKRLFISIIETNEEKIIEDLHSWIIFAKNKVVIKNPYNFKSATSLIYSNINDFQINKKVVSQLTQSINSILKNFYLYYFLLIILVIITLFATSYLLVNLYLLFGSLLVYIYFRLFKKRHFHYKKVFQISLHAVTLPLFLEYITFIFPVNFIPLKSIFFVFSPLVIPFLIIIVFTLFTLIGVLEAYNHQNHHQ